MTHFAIKLDPILTAQRPGIDAFVAALAKESPRIASFATKFASSANVAGPIAMTVVPIVDPPKKAKIAYPISTFTYAVVPTSANKQASLLKQFIGFAIGAGQSFGPKLDFVPLPKVVSKADKAMVGRLS